MLAEKITSLAAAANLALRFGAGEIALSAPAAEQFRACLLDAADRAERFLRGVRAPLSRPLIHEELRRLAAALPEADAEGAATLDLERSQDFRDALATLAARMDLAEDQALLERGELVSLEERRRARAARTPAGRTMH